jgi:DNA-directed RNA polymerase subunit RPC12/RpoP
MFHQLITSCDKGNMFACDQCQYKAETKALLNIHHNNLHQDMKYTCTTCGHQTSTKGGLTSAESVNTGHLQSRVSLNTKQQYMKARNIPATHVTIRQLKQEI